MRHDTTGRTACALLFLGIAAYAGAIAPRVAASAPPADAKPEQKSDQKADPKAEQPGTPNPFADSTEPFVPLHPRTVEERNRVEAEKAFARARALESERKWSEAVDELKKALADAPASAPILRRLTRLCFALNKNEEAVKYGIKAVEAEPGDAQVLRVVAAYLSRNDERDAAEALIRKTIADPRLKAEPAKRLRVLAEAARYYDGAPGRLEQAADSWGAFLEALDEPAAQKLPQVELRGAFGEDPGMFFLNAGRTLLAAKRYAAASQALQHGLLFETESVLLPLALGEALLGMNKPAEALVAVEDLLKRQPHGNEGYDLLARTLAALGREKEVLPRLEAAAKADPKNITLQYALAEAYRREGRADRADAILQSILQLAPDPQAYSALAASLLRDRKTEPLIKLLAQARGQRFAGEAVFPVLESIINDDKYVDEVLDVGLKMLAADVPARPLDDRIADLLSQIAQIAVRPKKLVEIAKAKYKSMPSAHSAQELESAQCQADMIEDAIATTDLMAREYDDFRGPEVKIHQAYHYALLDKTEKAVELLNEAMAEKPEPGSLWRIASVYIRLGNPDEALRIAERIRKQDPENPQVALNQAEVMISAGKNEEAIALLKDLLKKFSDDDDIVRNCRSRLSVAYVNLDDYAQGEKELEILLASNPDDAGVNNDLGYLYADQGKRLEQAEEMVRKALAFKKHESAYLDSLGWVLFKRGKFKDALPPLEEAVSTRAGGGDATVYDHLGDVYFELHEFDKAKLSWENAERLGKRVKPPEKRLPSIRKKLDSLKKLKEAPKTAGGDSI